MQTFASLTQFVHFCMLPFIDLDDNPPAALTISPSLLPTPGSVVPEITGTHLGHICYTASFHVSELELRVVITQEKSNPEDLDFSPILIDLECEKSAFEELLELKTEFGPANFDDYLECLETIDGEKRENYKDRPDEYVAFINSIIAQQDTSDFKDVYVTCAIIPDKTSI